MIASVNGGQGLEPLLRKLQRYVVFSEAEQCALVEAFGPPRPVERGEIFVEEASAGETVTVLLRGLASSSLSLPSGQRQTLAVHMPGDILDLTAFVVGVERPTACALTAVVVATVHYSQLKALIARHASIGLALWSDMAADGVIAREWLLSLGQRPALQNFARFICELHARQASLGLARGATCSFPLTQEQLGETLGLSAVHVNRILQQLRRDGLISVSQSKLTVLQPEELCALAGFDAAYLSPIGPAFRQISTSDISWVCNTRSDESIGAG